ncbi:MAG: hypothetical protein FWE95_07675 [Planctomycetaceae bacterium]|nr:hypothetical protein [Planctomycetaceae bacterium]
MKKLLFTTVSCLLLLSAGGLRATEVPFIELKEHTDGILHTLFLPDGKKFITVSGNAFTVNAVPGITRIWDAETGKELLERKGRFFSFSPDGKVIVTYTSTGDMGSSVQRMWEIETGRELHTELQQLNEWFRDFSPDGKKMITESRDGWTRIRDAESGAELKKWEGVSLTFSPDWKKIFMQRSFSEDRTIRILDAESGKELEAVEWHEGDTEYGTSIIFSPDEKRIVTMDGDGTAHLRDAESGKKIQSLGKNFYGFAPDGKRLATGAFAN